MKAIEKRAVFAQNVCRMSMEKVLPHILLLYTALEKKGFLTEETTVTFSAWNTGYEISVDYEITDISYRIDREQFLELNKLASYFRNCWLAPCSFFEKYIVDGEAYMEGRSSNLLVEYSNYRSAKLENEAEIETIGNNFAEICIIQIKNAIAKLNTL